MAPGHYSQGFVFWCENIQNCEYQDNDDEGLILFEMGLKWQREDGDRNIM